MGQDTEWCALERQIHYDIDDYDNESMYFFDAVDEPLQDEEYPIDGYVIKSSGGELGDYPIIFTTTLQHPAPRVSMEDPNTMLRSSLKVHSSSSFTN